VQKARQDRNREAPYFAIGIFSHRIGKNRIAHRAKPYASSQYPPNVNRRDAVGCMCEGEVAGFVSCTELTCLVLGQAAHLVDRSQMASGRLISAPWNHGEYYQARTNEPGRKRLVVHVPRHVQKDGNENQKQANNQRHCCLVLASIHGVFRQGVLSALVQVYKALGVANLLITVCEKPLCYRAYGRCSRSFLSLPSS